MPRLRNRADRSGLGVVAGLLATASLAGCGGGHATPASAPAVRPPAPAVRPPAPHGRVVVVFKREIGVDPLASYFTLYTSGQGTATVVYGGRNGAKVHRFRVGEAEVQQLEQLLRRTHLQNTGIKNPNLYTFWVITSRSAHRLSQGLIPQSARPLIDRLQAIAEANHLS